MSTLLTRWGRDLLTPPWTETFLVRDPDYSEEGTPIEASDPQEAAEKYADHYDSDHDYLFQSSDGIVLEVTAPNGTVSHWRVHGEQTVTYHSRAEEAQHV